ncbi:uncharacterized protein LAESUDRAFT_334655 [Laetiporus sulphureus 93-53]|uniref:Uncharacterized protein n=1 Tax=Laetiporus sulphureus 93-53 TaxID=1314785 RepID=A0A165CVM9_9APHY|nr:uncharacterized protein LAESUDRAFT_334655 [Laetiporus sulphureus 93-53]KZT03512.1 hypothetical protein LAESUDRAFT_334655 [Laetiporus sulphureus 93-53]
MRPTFSRLVRVIPRSSLPPKQAVRTVPEPMRSDVKQPTLIQILLERQAAAGDSYPSNIRIEPELTRATFKGVKPEVKRELLKVVREQ